MSSLATGLVSAAALPTVTPFVAVAALCLAVGLYLLRALPPHGPAAAIRATEAAGHPATRLRLAPLVLVGVLGALAFASENAHQSWSAVFARDELDASAGLAAVAPAVFAATVAVTRLAVGTFKATPAHVVLLVGALANAMGAVIIATAPSLVVAAGGLVVVGAGTAVLFPTLLAIVSRQVEESHRGRATSVVTTVSYLGFLLGPVYVGAWADGAGLRAAMVAVAALGVLLFFLAPALLRLCGFGSTVKPDGSLEAGPGRRSDDSARARATPES